MLQSEEGKPIATTVQFFTITFSDGQKLLPTYKTIDKIRGFAPQKCFTAKTIFSRKNSIVLTAANLSSLKYFNFKYLLTFIQMTHSNLRPVPFVSFVTWDLKEVGCWSLVIKLQVKWSCKATATCTIHVIVEAHDAACSSSGHVRTLQNCIIKKGTSARVDISIVTFNVNRCYQQLGSPPLVTFFGVRKLSYDYRHQYYSFNKQFKRA